MKMNHRSFDRRHALTLVLLCFLKSMTMNAQLSDFSIKHSISKLSENDKPTKELLDNQFFDTFNGDMPASWETKGKLTKIDENGRFSSNTGFALGISTNEEKGFLRQTINLKSKDVSFGDELECLLNYCTVESKDQRGPLRLAFRWLDGAGRELPCKDEKFINNSQVYFGRLKTYGTLKFRLTCPKNADKLDFFIEIAPNSSVRFDDFSLLRLSAKDRTPLVAILPQFKTVMGEVGVTKEYDVAIQTSHLTDMPTISYHGSNAESVLKLGVSKLEKDGAVLTKLAVTPAKKGVFVGSSSYALKVYGTDQENSGSFTLMGYFMAAGKKPSISLREGVKVREMKADVNKTDEQFVEFDIKNVFTNVAVALHQKPNGAFRLNTTQFYYSSKADKLYANKVKVSFHPKASGVYTATLLVSTPLSDTVKIELKGVCAENNNSMLTETFKAERPMDNRFKDKPAWQNFFKFDKGYWRLDGSWKSAGNILLAKKGILYFDEILANGVSAVKLHPSSSAQNCKAEYSIDGGGHWMSAEQADANGEFKVNTHRPTFIRFVNSSQGEIQVNRVDINENAKEDRQKFNSIQEGMMKNADSEALPLLNEDFTNLRHTRVLGLANWQNLTLRGERPFYAWEQKYKGKTDVENEVAQICFLKYGVEDKREHESWLLSPTLSYKQAKSKILTFSLRYANPIQDGGELFGFYIISEKDGKVTDQFVNLNDYSPAGVVAEKENWYNYRLDLSKIDSISRNIDDKFHIAFSFYSKTGGNETSLNFMIDNVTFGRTDLPELQVSKDKMQLLFRPGLRTAPQVFEVKAKNAVNPITVTLVPSSMNRYFTYTPSKLPKDGGYVSLIFKSDDTKPRAAMFLVQTPGAEPVMVKVLAMSTDGVSDVKRTPVKAMFKQGDIVIDGKYDSYAVYSLTGQQLRTGSFLTKIENVGEAPVILVVKIGKEHFRFKLANQE